MNLETSPSASSRSAVDARVTPAPGPSLQPIVTTKIPWWRPSPQPKHLLLIIGGLTGFGPLCIDMYLPGLPRLSLDLHASASSAQLTLTTCLIGIAVGQVVIGPISDRFGRRPPLFAGMATFVLASLACAFAPNIYVLIALRILQGFGGAAGLVVSRAIVRDLYSGVAAARFFSTLMVVTAAGPIFAPQIGAWILHFSTWRGVFVVLAISGLLLMAFAVTMLPETLPVERRNLGSFAQTTRTLRLVIRDRFFLGSALTVGFGFGALFSYIAGSSFVMENVYHLSPQRYSLFFALNGLGIVLASQINRRLVGRFGSKRMLTAGVLWLTTGGMLLLITVGPGHLGLPGLIVAQFAVVSSVGLTSPNALALALQDFPEAAGSASALIGAFQFSVGAFAAPLVGLGGNHDALPMALSIVSFGAMAVAVRLFLVRPQPATVKSA